MAAKWYYAKGGERHGPVSGEQLRQLAASGHIQPTDLVWKDGMAAWKSAQSVEGLFSSPAITPPLPTQPTGVPHATPPLLLVVLSLVVCFPIGLILVWLRPEWDKRRKWKWTGVTLGGVFVLLSIVGAIGQSANKARIAEADTLWTEGRLKEAVAKYKDARVLASKADRPRIYGRILDFEASQRNDAIIQTFLKEAAREGITPSCTTDAARSLVARSASAPTKSGPEAKPVDAVKATDKKQKGEKLPGALWAWQSEPDPSVATDNLDFDSVDLRRGPQGQPVETRTEKQVDKTIVLHGYTGKDGKWYLHGEQHEVCTGSYVPSRGAYGQVGHYVYGRKHGLFFEDLILHAASFAPSDNINTIVQEFYYYNDDLRKYVDYVNRRKGRKSQETHYLKGKKHGPDRMFGVDNGELVFESMYEHGVLKQ